MDHKCPNCGRLKTRRSAVRAYELTPRHIFYSPYRCRDCSHRFWVVSRNIYYLAGIIGVALVAGALSWNLRTLIEGPSSVPEQTALPNGQFAEIMNRAQTSDPDAEHQISVMYAHGYGVAKNEAESRKWLERAAQHGNVAAEYEFGVALRDGRGAVQDYERAVGWIRSAAESGHGPAQFALGVMYRAGTGVPLDNVKAYTWLNLAAAHGVYDAAVVRDAVLGRLSPSEVIEAQAEARRLAEASPTPKAPLQ